VWISTKYWVILTNAKLAKLCHFQISAVSMQVLNIQKWVMYGMLVQLLTQFIIVKCYFCDVDVSLNILFLFYSCTAMGTELRLRHTQLIHTITLVTGRMAGDSSQMWDLNILNCHKDKYSICHMSVYRSRCICSYFIICVCSSCNLFSVAVMWQLSAVQLTRFYGGCHHIW
jgi:hypothetical protein